MVLGIDLDQISLVMGYLHLQNRCSWFFDKIWLYFEKGKQLVHNVKYC